MPRLFCAIIASVIALVPLQSSAQSAQKTLPQSLSDSAFWRLSTELAEPDGYFGTHYFTSNETGYAAVVATIVRQGLRGGAYLGVGPEQNFHYIAALQPQIVFQIDIARSAVLQHFMYKAVFELARDRGDFVSLLFSKPRPPGIDMTSSIAAIWSAYQGVASDSIAYAQNVRLIVQHLTVTHGFAFSQSDIAAIKSIYDTFYLYGPDLPSAARPGLAYPPPSTAVTFRSLTAAVDFDRQPQSFLATEGRFRVVKQLHDRNLIIPVIADIAGPRGIRQIGAYLNSHNAQVTAFYISNVEDYLASRATSWYQNLVTLPVHFGSLLVHTGRTAIGGHVCRIVPYLQRALETQTLSCLAS